MSWVPVDEQGLKAPHKQPEQKVHCAETMLFNAAAAILDHGSKEQLGAHHISNSMEGGPGNHMKTMLFAHGHSVRVDLCNNALRHVFDFLKNFFLVFTKKTKTKSKNKL